ncbi:MAG: hypothetical protein SAqTSB_38680 [Shewanella algae]
MILLAVYAPTSKGRMVVKIMMLPDRWIADVAMIVAVEKEQSSSIALLSIFPLKQISSEVMATAERKVSNRCSTGIKSGNTEPNMVPQRSAPTCSAACMN